MVKSKQKPVGNHFIVKSTCASGELVTKSNACFGRDGDGGPYGFTLRACFAKAVVPLSKYLVDEEVE